MVLKKGPSVIHKSPSINPSMTKAKYVGGVALSLTFGASRVSKGTLK